MYLLKLKLFFLFIAYSVNLHAFSIRVDGSTYSFRTFGGDTVRESRLTSLMRCEGQDGFVFVHDHQKFQNQLSNRGSKTPCDFTEDTAYSLRVNSIDSLDLNVEVSQVMAGEHFDTVCRLHIKSDRGTLLSFLVYGECSDRHRSMIRDIVKEVRLFKQGVGNRLGVHYKQDDNTNSVLLYYILGD